MPEATKKVPRRTVSNKATKERLKEKLLLVFERRYDQLPPSERERASKMSSLGEIMDFIGIRTNTFYNWMKEDEEWARYVRTTEGYSVGITLENIALKLELENRYCETGITPNMKEPTMSMTRWFAERRIPEFRDKSEVDMTTREEKWEDVIRRNYAERKKREQRETK